MKVHVKAAQGAPACCKRTGRLLMPVCRPLAPDDRALLEAEARTQLALHALQGWQLFQGGALAGACSKPIPPPTLRKSLALAQRIGWLAEREQHHPEITHCLGALRGGVVDHSPERAARKRFQDGCRDG
jgi:pterin-4a-carbinolamine dehydratase